MFQQSSLKKVMALLVLALLLGVGFSFLGGSSSAHAATLDAKANVVTPHACSTRDGYVSGSEAYLTTCINSSTTTLQGWVKKVFADGKCVTVHAIFNNGQVHRSHPVCSKGEVEHFTWTEPTNGVSVELYASSVNVSYGP